MAATPAMDSPWRKSTESDDHACVEIAFREGGVLVRDSKSPNGPILRFTQAEWAAFVTGVHRGEFDLEGDSERS